MSDTSNASPETDADLEASQIVGSALPANGVRDLAAVLADLHGATVFHTTEPKPGEAVVVALPKGMQLHQAAPYLDHYRTHPRRRRGERTAHNLAGFLAVVTRWQGAGTVVYVNREASECVAVFNDHPGSHEESDAGFADFRAYYPVEKSTEFEAWLNASQRELSTTDFAEFLEERVVDVLDVDTAQDDAARAWSERLGATVASPSKLLELARGLSVNVSAAVKDARTLSSGEIAVSYVESHTDGAGVPLKIPSLFFVAIPVFRDGTPYRVPVRLRYRVSSGRITWRVLPSNLAQIVADAWGGLRQSLEDHAAVSALIVEGAIDGPTDDE